MTSDLSIGTAVQQGGRTIVTGTVSDLDTNALIENAVQANNREADQIDIRVQDNDAKVAAYEEYFGLANNLQTALDPLKSQTSFSSESINIFEQRTGNLSSDGAEPTGLINVAIETNAVADSYEIVVEQKAEAFSTSSTIVTDKDAALGASGSFDISIDGQTPVTINVAAGDSLQDLADAINFQTNSTGVEASILKVSETDFQLVITGTDTNKAMSVQTNSGNVLQSLGIVDGGDAFAPAQIIQDAQGSIVTFNGATITRDDNNYDDLIDGVTFDIRAADPSTTITLEINNDASAAKDAIIAFVDSYNALRDFVIQNQQVNSDGTVPEDAVLFSEPLLENYSFSLTNLITDGINTDSSIRALSDIGITFDDDNRLVIDDETKLDEALLNDFDDVKNLFTTDVEISNSQLGIISNTSTAVALDFEIDITTDLNGDIVSASVAGNTNAFDIEGDRLVGREGTQFEELVFAYIGDTDATISVSLSAGLADQMYNLTEGYTNPSDGLIQTEINLINAQNEDYTAEIEEIRARGEVIREQEIEKYSKMEAELSRLESLKSLIQSLFGNDDS